MKRLLTKTLSLTAVLFMGAAFSVSCNSSSAEPEVVVNTTKDALKYLNTHKNYTFTYSGDNLIPHSYVFTENAIGRVVPSKPEADYAYYSDEGGTFQIEYSETYGKYVTTEYRSTENVWNSSLVSDYYDVGTKFIDELDDGESEIRIKNTDYKRAFISMMGYSADDFMDIDSLTASYDADAKELTFKIVISSKIHYYTVTDFGTSKLSILDNFPNGIKACTADYDFQMARTLMATDNYIQGIYYIDGDDSGYVGNYLFNPHYFAQVYDSSDTMNGYISLHCDAEEGDNPHPALNGTYYFTIGTYKTNPTPSVNSNAISTNSNVAEVMNYPSHLSVFDNFQRFVNWDGTDTEKVNGAGYYTDDSEILADFSENFNMDSSFSGQSPAGLGIDITVNGNDDDSVIFYYYFKYGNTKMVYPIPFYKFGSANVGVLDQIYSLYHTIED